MFSHSKSDLQTFCKHDLFHSFGREERCPAATPMLVFLCYILIGQFEVVLCVDSSESSSNRRFVVKYWFYDSYLLCVWCVYVLCVCVCLHGCWCPHQICLSIPWHASPRAGKEWYPVLLIMSCECHYASCRNQIRCSETECWGLHVDS